MTKQGVDRVRTVSVRQRRRAVVRRHHLGGDAPGPEEVTRALVALHATDPASVYLSVLARSTATTLGDVAAAMYERRSLVRWMAMRRTLFLLLVEDIPMVQAAISTPLAATLRRRLLARIRRNGSEPPIDGDPEQWLADTETRVEQALRARVTASGAQLADAVPDLRTRIPARTRSERPETVTSPLLTMLSAQGRLVRAIPTGPWTSRHHRWEPVENWWPDGIPAIDTVDAEAALAHRWLTHYGPATVEDLRWWTGWNKTTTRRALDHLAVEEIDLHGQAGITLTDNPDRHADDPSDDDPGDDDPVVSLLPALDPTPMGWKHRDWLFGIDPQRLFDNAGNIGPTLWCNGEIIGSWAVTATGDIRTLTLTDRGTDTDHAIDNAAQRLHRRLHHTVVTPAARTPLERSLADDTPRPGD